MDTALTHRCPMGHDYQGIQIHAARGVHDFAAQLLKQYVGAGTVLDVGSGSGALAQRLSDAGFRVTASDISLHGFAAKVPSAIWDASSTDAPPIQNADAVAAVEILEHVDNVIATLKNFKRALKPGGFLVASTPNVGHPRSRLKFLLTGSPSYFGPGEYRGSGHRTILPDWLLKAHLESVGFKIVRTAYAGSMDMSPTNRALMPLLNLAGRIIGAPKVDDGDGACSFFVATT